MNDIILLFHHIHHTGKKHEVHHCGGKHRGVDPKVNYVIAHCKCGKHSINKKTAVGHALDGHLRKKEIKIVFIEKCPQDGWHIESGIKT